MTFALIHKGADIHDGQKLHHRSALCEDAAGQFTIIPDADAPADGPTITYQGGIIAPRFVDLQVNGGGGVMFNDDQSVAALRVIADAHASLGTGAILPTLITDTPARTRAAIDATEAAIAAGVDGIAGIHLEGPHLSVARKGAHDPSLIRPMTDDDLVTLTDAASRLPNVMVTVAPENVTNAQIRAMAQAGIIVSLGHTDADYETCIAAFDAGATCVTHLFNAMSQLTNRQPGLVGAVLDRADIYAGLIADGIHVDPASIRIAVAAKPMPNRIFLVTDAMATAGSAISGFSLNGRQVARANGRLTLKDGTLAGADVSMSQALGVMTKAANDSIEQAISRATSTPASLLRSRGKAGTLDGGLIYISAGTNGNWSSISRVTSAIR